MLVGQRLQKADLLIEGGVIASVASPEELHPLDGDAVLDATGRLVFPGLINAHFHSHDVLARGLIEEEYLESWILRVLPPAYPPRSSQEVEVRTMLGALDNLKTGVTSVQDMVTLTPFDPELLGAVVRGYESVGIRAAVGVQYSDLPGSQTRPLQMSAFPEHQRSRIVSPAEPGDGDTLEAVLSSCFRSPPASSGLVEWVLAPTAPESCSDSLLQRTAQAASDYDAQVFTHANESKTRAVEARMLYPEYGGSVLRRMHLMGLSGPRVNIAHGVWFSAEEIALLAETCTGVVLNVLSNLKLKSGVPPLRAYLDSGVRVALGTDNLSCSDAANMLQAMKLTALLYSASHHERLASPSEYVFRAATAGGAQALGHGGERGILEQGMAADLFTVDATDPTWLPLNSPIRQLLYSESGRGVRDAMVGGRIVLREGRSTMIDEDELRERVQEVAAPYLRDFESVSAEVEAMRAGLDRAHAVAASTDLGFDRMV